MDDKLKEKLRDILFKAAGGITDMADDEIAQIHQAFVEAGYAPLNGTIVLPPREPENVTVSVGVASDLMTGTAWYDRFIIELERLIESGVVSKHTDLTDGILAAQKAAGLTPQDKGRGE